MTYKTFDPAAWSMQVPGSRSAASRIAIREKAVALAARSQYGWGHTIDFGGFRMEGLLKDSYLRIAGGFDHFRWWPQRLDGMAVADIGCFTGGLALLLAQRGARIVYAVDEVPEHLAQCELLVDAFETPQVHPILKSVYQLAGGIPAASLDLVVLSGVLYHLSDMLVGLYALRELLKPDGTLLIESNGIDDATRSYANFGRFYGGMWWQPTALCIADMCEYMGYKDVVVEFYQPDRCIARAVKSDIAIDYRRGLNFAFDSLRDRKTRSLDPRVMAPARNDTTG